VSREGQSRHPIAVVRRATRRRVEGHDDAGFTLIEIIVVVAILPLIVGGITVALLAVFGLQNQTTNRIGDSNDALTSASFFNKDVQSAQEIETLTTPACGTSSQTQVLGLEWAQDANGNYDTVVSYVLTNGNGNGSGNSPSKYLVRQICTAGASTAPNSTFVVSHDAGSPTLTFNPSTPLFIGPNATWKSTQGLYGVTLTTTEPGSTYTYSLSGVPSASTSTGQASQVTTTPNPAGCNLASPGSGTYANILCFADFTSFTDPSSTCQQMKLSIANSPDYLQFCVIETPTNSAAPQQIPTYYGASDGGYDSEAFLGNNGFYTGVSGLPALSQRAQTSATLNTPTWPNGFAGSSNALTTITFSNIQVVNAVGEPATGWTLVTGDAESTDTNGWLEFQNSDVQWNILPNSSTSLWGNSCYDSLNTAAAIPGNTANNGVLNWIGPTPPTAAEVGMSGSSGTNLPPSTSYVSALPAGLSPSDPATNSNGVLCQANISLNKTGSLMVAAPEPSGSTAPQTVTVTMQGESYQAIFLGVLL
jgi:prepilin-type N-terminal cleavage/methylation domain-containing protein